MHCSAEQVLHNAAFGFTVGVIRGGGVGGVGGSGAVEFVAAASSCSNLN